MRNAEFGSFELPSNDHDMKQQLLRFGAHQRTDLEMLLDAVSPEDTVVDFGAHVGTFTIPLAMKAHDVVCLEADKTRFEILLRNIKTNDLSNIRPFNVLVAAEESTFAKNTIRSSDELTQLAPLWERSQGHGRKSTPAHSILNQGSAPPSVIKSDIEGLDYEVLASIKPFIKTNAPTISAEFDLGTEEQKKFSAMMEELEYATFINAAPRNSSIFTYAPVPLSIALKAGINIYFDIFAAPLKSQIAQNWLSEYNFVGDAFVAFTLGKYDVAMNILDKAALMSQNFYFLKAKCGLRTGSYKNALQACEAGIQQVSNAESMSLLSECLLANRKLAEAVNAATSAVELNPLDSEAYFRLGVANKAIGNKQAAKEAIEQAISIDTKRPALHNMLSSLR